MKTSLSFAPHNVKMFHHQGNICLVLHIEGLVFSLVALLTVTSSSFQEFKYMNLSEGFPGASKDICFFLDSPRLCAVCSA